jgi:hypothetical protein
MFVALNTDFCVIRNTTPKPQRNRFARKVLPTLCFEALKRAMGLQSIAEMLNYACDQTGVLFASLDDRRTYVRAVKNMMHVEIEGWLRQSGRTWVSWVVLDDRGYLFKPFLPNLVVCDPKVELNGRSGKLLRMKLMEIR